jgi:integrase
VKAPRCFHDTETVALSTEDVRMFLAAARELAQPAETAIALMATLGLRADECGRLVGTELQPTPWGDCLLIQGKGDKPALVPVTGTVTAAAERCGWPGAKNFGKPFDPNRARQRTAYLVKIVRDKLGMPGVHPHAFRHFFVTTLLDNGVPLHQVQDAARHSDPGTTQRYNDLRNRVSTARTAGDLIADLLDPCTNGSVEGAPQAACPWGPPATGTVTAIHG